MIKPCPVCNTKQGMRKSHRCPGRVLNEEEQKAWKYLNWKRTNAKQRGLDFDLELDDMMEMLASAGITMDQIGGNSGRAYQLARYGDAGGYTQGNCRFITMRENRIERNSL